MYIVRRTLTFVRGILLQLWSFEDQEGFWDKDFSGDKWNFIDNTVGDCVYPHLEKYARNGNILDLGCGPGNTANELDLRRLSEAMWVVDISEVALAKAAKRTQENGRTEKNSFVCSDFLGYRPTQKFDIILFRESLYHVPYGQVLKMLEKYSKHLKDERCIYRQALLGRLSAREDQVSRETKDRLNQARA